MKHINPSGFTGVLLASIVVIVYTYGLIISPVAVGLLLGLIVHQASEIIVKPRGFKVVTVANVRVPFTRDGDRMVFPAGVIERRNNVWYILDPKTMKELTDPLQSEQDAITIMMNAERRVIEEKHNA